MGLATGASGLRQQRTPTPCDLQDLRHSKRADDTRSSQPRALLVDFVKGNCLRPDALWYALRTTIPAQDLQALKV